MATLEEIRAEHRRRAAERDMAENQKHGIEIPEEQAAAIDNDLRADEERRAKEVEAARAAHRAKAQANKAAETQATDKQKYDGREGAAAAMGFGQAASMGAVPTLSGWVGSLFNKEHKPLELGAGAFPEDGDSEEVKFRKRILAKGAQEGLQKAAATNSKDASGFKAGAEQIDEKLAEHNPTAYAAGELGGYVAQAAVGNIGSAPIKGLKALTSMGAKKGAKAVADKALRGAVPGAVQGYVNSDGETVTERLNDSWKPMLAGAGMNAAGNVLPTVTGLTSVAMGADALTDDTLSTKDRRVAQLSTALGLASSVPNKLLMNKSTAAKGRKDAALKQLVDELKDTTAKEDVARRKAAVDFAEAEAKPIIEYRAKADKEVDAVYNDALKLKKGQLKAQDAQVQDDVAVARSERDEKNAAFNKDVKAEESARKETYKNQQAETNKAFLRKKVIAREIARKELAGEPLTDLEAAAKGMLGHEVSEAAVYWRRNPQGIKSQLTPEAQAGLANLEPDFIEQQNAALGKFAKGKEARLEELRQAQADKRAAPKAETDAAVAVADPDKTQIHFPDEAEIRRRHDDARVWEKKKFGLKPEEQLAIAQKHGMDRVPDLSGPETVAVKSASLPKDPQANSLTADELEAALKGKPISFDSKRSLYDYALGPATGEGPVGDKHYNMFYEPDPTLDLSPGVTKETVAGRAVKPGDTAVSPKFRAIGPDAGVPNTNFKENTEWRTGPAPEAPADYTDDYLRKKLLEGRKTLRSAAGDGLALDGAMAGAIGSGLGFAGGSSAVGGLLGSGALYLGAKTLKALAEKAKTDPAARAALNQALETMYGFAPRAQPAISTGAGRANYDALLRSSEEDEDERQR